MVRWGVVLCVLSCGPKPTDTSEMQDVNPCESGEILQADGSCIPAGEPILPPEEPADDTGNPEDDTGGSDQDTGASQT